MKLQQHLKTTLLLTMGLLLTYIIPPIFLGMKFDFLLIFMFISIFINPSKENIILTSFLAGILSALATTFPMGQIPNFIDKIATGILSFILINKLKLPLNKFTILAFSLLGTIFSGFIFLQTAKLLLGANLEITSLLKYVVLPTALINTIGTMFIYKLILKAIKIANLKA